MKQSIVPIPDIVINIGNRFVLADFILIVNNLVDQFREVVFLINPKSPPCIFLDLSKCDISKISNETWNYIAQSSKFEYIKKITILIDYRASYESILLKLANKSKVQLIVKCNDYSYSALSDQKLNSCIDIKFQLHADSKLSDVYQALSQLKFKSIDFIVFKDYDLVCFTNQLIQLAERYFTENTESPLLSINRLAESYFTSKIYGYIKKRNPLMIIDTKGDISISENYLFPESKHLSLKSWNIFGARLITLILKKEYYRYFPLSCMNRLERDCNDALCEFVHRDMYSDNEAYSSPLILFYENFSRKFDSYIETMEKSAVKGWRDE